MASPVQFAVDDSSPVLAFSPFADTFGQPDLAAGWNPYFVNSGFVSSIGQTGIGESQHITSRNGSSVSLRWHGTALQLFGNTTADASLSLVLDGVSLSPNISDHTPNLLAFLDGLEHSDHILVLTALTPSPPGPSLVVFDKAVITDHPPQNSSNLIFSDHTLKDNDISFAGQWSQLTFPHARESTSQGDTAQVTFSGISIRIFGTTSPSSGNYSIILDDIQSPIFSARSSFTQHDSLLFFASGLDTNVSHHIIIRNEGGSLQLKSGGSGFDIFSSGEPTALPSPSPPSSSSPPANTPSPPSGIGKFAKGTIAALVLAGFLAATLLTAVLFYFCIWRPRRRRKRGRQQRLDAVQEATSQLRRNPKEEQNNRVLDIGQQHHPDDILLNSPVDPLTPLAPINTSNGERHPDSKPSPGFARWKRDINALSGLTNVGLKFRHEDSDEKSPLSENGRGERGRRYTLEGDEISPISPAVGRMMSLTTQSSYRSLRRLGKKRSAGNNNNNNGGSRGGGGFPFRFNSGRSSSNNGGGGGGEGPISSPRGRDEDSLSGLTSLSYASNTNLGQSGDATATTMYLDLQPPSYAASVSQQTTSGSSSGVPSPRVVGGEPLSVVGQEGRGVQGSGFEKQQQRQSSSSSSSGNQQQRSDTRMRGIRMLGLSTSASGGGGGGVGGPVSMRAAIRGLSPRISRTQNGKEKEVVIGEDDERERVAALSSASQPSIALASLGHGQGGREGVEIPPPVPPLPMMMVMMPERRKTDSPTIRALPPIPITTMEASSKLDDQRQQQQQRRRGDVDISTTTVPLLPPPSSPPSSSSSSSPHSPTPSPPIITEKKPFINTKVTRSSPGDAVGLPPLGAIQSFSEAAAIAINTGGEGSDSSPPPTAATVVAMGEGQRETKRSSTASRVRFEEPLSTGDDDTSTPIPVDGDRRGKEEKKGFRLTPPTPPTIIGVQQQQSSSSSSESPHLPRLLPPGALPPFMAMPVAEYSRSSFLDLSSQPPSLYSTPSVRRGDNNDDDDDDGNENENDRIWSMQLPGRQQDLEDDTKLKSKWSNTTMQTVTRTLGGGGGSSSSSSAASNNHSGYGPSQRQPIGPEGDGDGDVLLLSPMTRQNLFPFPLAIPPSPNMPEGFMGVEPSPSLMSPNVSLPVPFSSSGRGKTKEEGKGKGKGKRRFLGVVTSGFGRDDGGGEDGEGRLENPLRVVSSSSSRRTGNDDNTTIATTTATTTDSPTDSFPYSISDVHFRNSGVFVSEPEMGDTVNLDEGGDNGRHSRRHRHRHGHHHQSPPPHPPLPSLTPQRFDPSSLSQQSLQTPLPSLTPQRFDPSSSLSQQSRQPVQAPLIPQRFDPSLSQQSHPPQPAPLPPQQQQERERTQSFTSSIVQRVFGTR